MVVADHAQVKRQMLGNFKTISKQHEELMSKAQVRFATLDDFRDRADLVMEVVANRQALDSAFQLWICAVNFSRLEKQMEKSAR